MNAFFDSLIWVAVGVLENSWQAAVLMAVVILTTLLLRGRLSARWRSALWLLVVARLLMPVALESPVSLFNLLPAPIAMRATEAEPPVDVAVVEAMPVDESLAREPSMADMAAFPAGAPSFPSGNQVIEPSREPVVLPQEHDDVASVSTAQVVWRSVVFVWLFGTAVLLLRMMLLMLRLHVLLRRCFSLGSGPGIGSADAAPIPAWDEGSVLGIFEAARRELGIRRRVELLVLPLSVGPAVTGIFRPRLILAESLLAKLSSDELRLVFLHELSHIRRQDLLVQRLWQCAEVLHWFNPVVWLAARRWQTDRELACDEAVLARLDQAHRAGYGHAILRVMESLATLRPVPGAVGVLMRRGFLTARIQKIATYRPLSRRWTALAVILLLLLIPLGLTSAKQSSKPDHDPALEESNQPQKPDPDRADEIPAQTIASSLKMFISAGKKDDIFLGPCGSTPGTVKIPACEDRCFNLYDLRPDNVDDYKKEIQRLGIRRINVFGTYAQLKEYRDAGLFDGIISLAIHGYDESGHEKPADLSCLSDLPDLKNLVLGHHFKLTDLSSLPTLQNLTSLEVEGCSHLKDLSALSRMPNLKKLELTFCDGLADLSSLPKLRELTSLCVVRCDHLKKIFTLPDLPKLKQIELSRCDNLTDISGLARFERLEMLKLCHCDSLDAKGLSALSGVKNLKWLDLESSLLDDPDQDASFLSDLKGLETLELDVPLYATNVDFLSGLKKLKSLYLSGTGNLTDLSAISEMKELEKLTVGSCSITNLDFLLDHPQLAEVRIFLCPDLAGIFSLAGCKNLKSLSLGSSHKIKPQTIQWLQKQLPDCQIHYTRPRSITSDAESEPSKAILITGCCLDEQGNPVAGAAVTVVGWKRVAYPLRGSLKPQVAFFRGTRTSRNGGFRIRLPKVSAESCREAVVFARVDGKGVAWKNFDADTQAVDATLVLLNEKPIRGRLLDKNGKPAAGVSLQVSSVMGLSMQERLGLGPDEHFRQEHAAWLPQPVTTDSQGRFVLHGISPGRCVTFVVKGNDRFATQTIYLGFGISEAFEKQSSLPGHLPYVNIQPGEEALVTLQPPQIFEGVVRYEDTGKPVPHARLNVGIGKNACMVMHPCQADDEGHWRISITPGETFCVDAFPPDGKPYLGGTVGEVLKKEDSPVKHVDVTLSRGVLVRGKVIDQKSKKPIAGAVVYCMTDHQYNSEAIRHVIKDAQAIQTSDKDGRFEIAILPRKGYLFVNSSDHGFIKQEISLNEMWDDKPGGSRYHAHAIKKIVPKSGEETIEVTVPLVRGESVRGRIVDEKGDPIGRATILSDPIALSNSPYPNVYTPLVASNGQFELSGLVKDKPYRVCFLDTKNRLGVSTTVQTGQEPIIILRPCGEATATFVDNKGKPMAGLAIDLRLVRTPASGAFSDEEIPVSMCDGTNYKSPCVTDKEGKFTFPALIPDATYRVYSPCKKGDLWQMRRKDFTVGSGETVNLGKIVVDQMGVPSNVNPHLGPIPVSVPAKPINPPWKTESGRPDPERADEVTTITGRCVDEQGKPVAGAAVAAVAFGNRSGTKNQQEILAETTTGADGKYRMTLQRVTAELHRSTRVLARAEGLAQAGKRFDPDEKAVDISLTLLKEKPIHLRFVDPQGNSVAGVRVRCESVWPTDLTEETFREVTIRGPAYSLRPLKAWMPSGVADEKGRWVLHGVADDHTVQLVIQGNDQIRPQDLRINSGKPGKDDEKIRKFGERIENAKPDGETLIVLEPSRVLEGVIRYEDTGKPMAGAHIIGYPGESVPVSNHRRHVSYGQTDAEGRYRFYLPRGDTVSVLFYPPKGAPYHVQRHIIRDLEEKSLTKQIDINLSCRVQVHGKVIDAKSKRPIAGAHVAVIEKYWVNKGYKPGRAGVLAETTTDHEGEYHLNVTKVASESSACIIIARAEGMGMVSQSFFDPRFDFILRRRIYPKTTTKVPAARAIWNDQGDSRRVLFELTAEKPVRGRLVDPQGKPVAGARLSYDTVYTVLSLKDAKNQKLFSAVAGMSLPVCFRKPPKAWPKPIVTDEEGRFVVHGIPQGPSTDQSLPQKLVHLAFEGNEQFPPQRLGIGWGESPKDPKASTVWDHAPFRYIQDGEEAVLTLQPPTMGLDKVDWNSVLEQRAINQLKSLQER